MIERVRTERVTNNTRSKLFIIVTRAVGYRAGDPCKKSGQFFHDP